jgi:Dolichyl-phosphate-mannose-protein mannosyltransferase
VLCIVLLALLVRLAYLAVAREPAPNFPWLLADGLLRHGSLSLGGVRTTAFEPVYPVFLAIARRMTGDRMMLVRVVQSAVAALGAALLYRLASALTGRRRVGYIAAMLYACYPLLIRYAVDLSDATITTVLMLGFASAFVAATTPALAAGAGIWLGLTMLTRMMTLPLAALGGALLWRERGWRSAAAFTGTALLLVAPYVTRNIALGGGMLPTRSGVNLFIANCDYTPRILPDYGPDILEEYAASVLRGRADVAAPSTPAQERTLDAAYTRLAVEHIAANPGQTLRLKVRNLGYFLSPFLVPRLDPAALVEFRAGSDGSFVVANGRPRPLVDRATYTLSYTIVCTAALWGVWIRRRQFRHDAILWAALVTFAAVHAIYFATTRYRVPVEFVLLVYAAVAIDDWMRRRQFDAFGSTVEAEAWVRRARNTGSDTNQPANAVLGTVPSTAVT